MEVKIFCACGAKYKFDVEPLNGKIPAPVFCPVCNADGTQLGNQIIADHLRLSSPQAGAPPEPRTSQTGPPDVNAAPAGGGGFIVPSVPRSSKEAHRPAPNVAHSSPQEGLPGEVRVAAQAAGAPVASHNNRMVAPTPGSAPRLSVSVSHPAPAAANPVERTHIQTAPPIPVPIQSAKKIEAEPSFARGIVGIAAASFIGLLFWFAVTYFIGVRIKWFAILIGAFIGWTGAWLSREKSVRLGITASVATILVLLIGLLWSARHEAYIAVNQTLDEIWTERLAYAKAAVKASRSDAELQKFLEENADEEQFADEDEEDARPNPAIVRANASSSSAANTRMLSDFKRNELPELRKLAEGRVSRSQFDREHRPAIETAFTFGYIIANTFRVRVLIFICLAVGSAWKLTSGQ